MGSKFIASAEHHMSEMSGESTNANDVLDGRSPEERSTLSGEAAAVVKAAVTDVEGTKKEKKKENASKAKVEPRSKVAGLLAIVERRRKEREEKDAFEAAEEARIKK